MSIVDMVQVLYPSLYSIHDLPPDIGDIPPPLADPSENVAISEAAGRGVEGIWGRPRAGVDVPFALPPTSENLSSEGVFLLDSGEDLLLYVGRSVHGEVMQELFGEDAVAGGFWSFYLACCRVVLHCAVVFQHFLNSLIVTVAVTYTAEESKQRFRAH